MKIQRFAVIRRRAISFVLALVTMGFVLLEHSFRQDAQDFKAIAQTIGVQQADAKAALDDFFAELAGIGLRIEQADSLLRQNQLQQFQQGLELYQQALDERGRNFLVQFRQTYPGLNRDRTFSNADSRLRAHSESREYSLQVYKTCLAIFKLALLAEKLNLSTLTDRTLSAAADLLRQATDDLTIFQYSEKQPSEGATQRSARGSLLDDKLFIPHLKLLQQVYALRGRSIARWQNDRLMEQEQYYLSLQSSELIRTFNVDRNILGQLIRNRNDDSGDKLFSLAEIFSRRITVDNIKQIAKDEDAVIVSYSIIVDQNEIRQRLAPEVEHFYQGFRRVTVDSAERVSRDKLLMWVVKPTGEITFAEQQVASNLVPGNFTQPDNPCERVFSEECRGQSSTAIAQLVRLTRSAIGVKVRGQIGTRDTQQGNNNEVNSAYAISGNTQHRLTSPEQLNQQSKTLKQLYNLLIEPIKDSLPSDTQSRIIFIPQGSLSFVPFAALIDSTGAYLLKKYTIQTAPNLRTLLFAHSNRQRSTTDNRNILIVGNPAMPEISTREGALSQRLEDLPFAEQEAQAINQLFEMKGYDPELLLSEQATELRVRERMLSAKIIHLATHGILDAEDLSHSSSSGLFSPRSSITPTGSIALASSGEDSGNNGFLTAAEIFWMQIKADLVVLSACNTGLGPLAPGGVVGLPFSLSVAGVPLID